MSASVNFCRSACARLEVVGEPRQHVGQAPGFRAGARPGRDRASENVRGQRASAPASVSPAATCARSAADELRRARVVGLLGDRGERLVERHARRASVASCRVDSATSRAPAAA